MHYKIKKPAILSSVLLIMSCAIYATPVRVVVYEAAYPNFQLLGCTNNQLDTPNCRVYKKLNCPTTNYLNCIVNESAVDNGNSQQNHATTVSKFVTTANNDIEIISAKGNALGIMRWINHNYQTDNIKVLNNTFGGAPSENQVCSDAKIYHHLYNSGVLITHASGNQWANGLTYNPLLGYAPKGVTDESCAYQVLSIGASGSGLHDFALFKPDGFQTKCLRPEPYYGDYPPNTDIGTFVRVPIDCYSNAGPHLDYLAEPNGNSSMEEGTSFSAPKVAGLIANYHTHNPGKSNDQVKNYLNSMSTNVVVNIPGVTNDTYKKLTTVNHNNQLNSINHTFKEGYWYNPERSGWGMNVAEVNNTYYLTWYTYDLNGKPVWYTASGNFYFNQLYSTITKTTKAVNSNRVNSVVGNLTISLINDQEANFSWDFTTSEQSSSSGSERMTHLNAIGEGVDGGYSGLWYNQLDSGWGMSPHLSYGFGGFNFTALYYFDNFGNPIWSVGQLENSSSSGTIPLEYFNGSCPSCTWQPTTKVYAGSLDYDFIAKKVNINVYYPFPWPRPLESINQGWIDVVHLTYE